MTLDQRIERLAAVVIEFPEMGDFGSEEELWKLVRSEWKDGMSPPSQILHIISANTAMAGMQSLVRGLLLGSKNWCKIPSSGLPRFIEFVERLPMELGAWVEVSASLPEKWLSEADAVIVFGSDTTVEKFRAAVREDQIFAGYGNRWSGAVIFSDPSDASIASLVPDVCLYEQMGCLSAQIVWLHTSIDAVDYGKRLAKACQNYIAANPPPPLAPADAASVARWRLAAEWQTVEDAQSGLWLSPGEPVWGVWLTSRLGLSCLHRHVRLLPFTDLPDLGELAASVSTLGVWPSVAAARLAGTGASRICPVGEMQFPHPTWQQDGAPALGRLLGKKTFA
jgi:hypothetical protein